MPIIKLYFSEQDTLPELMDQAAKDLNITIEQLIKRFICTGIQSYEDHSAPTVPGKTLDDFCVKNGLMTPREE